MAKLYYVEAIDVKELTKNDIKEDLQIWNLKNNRQRTFEEHCDFLNSWGWDKYKIESKIASYHTSFSEAVKYGFKNMGDIYENGECEYVAVCSVYYGDVFNGRR